MVETIEAQQESIHSTVQSGPRRPNHESTYKEATTMTRRWYSIAVEYPHGLEIFRCELDHEESANIWSYFNNLKQQGSVGRFAVVKDDLASPLPDDANKASWTEEFKRTIAWLSPVLETQ